MKKKRLLSLLLAIAAVLTCVLPAYANILGDVDNDGRVTAMDARSALRYSVGLGSYTAEMRTAADINKDGFVSAEDARSILRMSVGLDSPFETALYDQAHAYFHRSAAEMPGVALDEQVYRVISTWCAFYTIHDVFVPVLKKLGYNDAQINTLAPTHFSRNVMQQAMKNGYGYNLPGFLFTPSFPLYVPSVLMDYYRNHPASGTFYTFRQYYDDIVTESLYEPSENRYGYVPEVGDIVFISNKETTYVNGVPTVDHTGQIIQVNEAEGTFLCTEGAIIEYDDVDRLPRVRERSYHFNPDLQTFQWENNNIVFVVAVHKPNLAIEP